MLYKKPYRNTNTRKEAVYYKSSDASIKSQNIIALERDPIYLGLVNHNGRLSFSLLLREGLPL